MERIKSLFVRSRSKKAGPPDAQNSSLPSMTTDTSTGATELAIPRPPKKLPAAPNELMAMSNHFSQLLPALVGLAVVVLVTVLSDGFPVKFRFWFVNNQHIIAALSVLAAFLFYDGSQKSYFAQSHDLAQMKPGARKLLFNGSDPFDYCFNEQGRSWSDIVNGYMQRVRLYSRKAIWRLELGTISIFLSIVFLLGSYHLWLGGIGLILVIVHLMSTTRSIVKELGKGN